MKLIKLVILFCPFIFCSQIGYTQEISQASESVKKIAHINVNKWKKALSLSVNQSEKMLNQVIVYEMKKRKIYKSETPIETKNSELESLELTHNKSIESFLSKEQIEKYHGKITAIKNQ